jgi:hypothetical protein
VAGSLILLLLRLVNIAARHAGFVFLLCLAIPILPCWSALGFFLLSHRHGSQSDLRAPQFWQLDQLNSCVVGFAWRSWLRFSPILSSGGVHV